MTTINSVDVMFDSTNAGKDPLITGTRDNPTFTLLPPISNCVGISVISADVPFTYYTIDVFNQWFAIQNNSNAAVTRRCRKLTPGTYNQAEFVTHFNQVGRTAGYDSNGTIAPNGVSDAPGAKIFIDPTDGKIILGLVNTNANGDDLGYTTTLQGSSMVFLTNIEVPNRCCPDNIPVGGSTLPDLLGWPQNNLYFFPTTPNTTLYDNNLNLLPSTGSFIKAPKPVRLAGPKQMFLQSNLAGQMHGSVRNQLTMQPLISFWPVNALYQGTIDMFRERPIIMPATSSTISKIDLSLIIGSKQMYGNSYTTQTPYLQLNGESFRAAIRFHIQEQTTDIVQDEAGNNFRSLSSASYEKMPNPTRRLR
jgi:hypothetical protein